jgi:hypothetical protein
MLTKLKLLSMLQAELLVYFKIRLFLHALLTDIPRSEASNRRHKSGYLVEGINFGDDIVESCTMFFLFGYCSSI